VENGALKQLTIKQMKPEFEQTLFAFFTVQYGAKNRDSEEMGNGGRKANQFLI